MEYARKKRYRDRAVGSLQILLRSQQEAHRQLARKLASARYRRLITELDQWIASDNRRHTGRLFGSARADIFSQRRLLSWRNKICRKGKHLQTMRSKQLHRFRIRCKHYRYIGDSLRSLGIPLSDRDLAFCKIAKRAHRDFGDIRDLRRFRKVTHGRPLGYRRQKAQAGPDDRGFVCARRLAQTPISAVCNIAASAPPKSRADLAPTMRHHFIIAALRTKMIDH
jgi:hypothetical protein